MHKLRKSCLKKEWENNALLFSLQNPPSRASAQVHGASTQIRLHHLPHREAAEEEERKIVKNENDKRCLLTRSLDSYPQLMTVRDFKDQEEKEKRMAKLIAGKPKRKRKQ